MRKEPPQKLPSSWPTRGYQWLRLGAGLVLAYTVLTVYFLRPLTTYFSSVTPAGGFSSDQCQTIWFFWWTKSALANPGLSLFWSDAVYFPYGTGLGYHLCLFTNFIAIGFAGLLGLPINSPALFNLLVMFSFVLTGIGAFMLIRVVTGRSIPAFIGSLFVTFAPYRLWHLDHLNLLSTGWVLIAVSCALLFFKRPRITSLAGAIFTMAVACYVSLTNVMIASLFLGVYVIVFARQILKQPQRKRIISGVCVGIVATVILALPGLMKLDDVGANWNVGWQDTEQHSPDVVDFIWPTERQQATGSGEAYLGWFLLGLALVAITLFRASDTGRWGIIAGVFLVLALGPTLMIAGHKYLAGWLPYRWLFDSLPYFNLARTPTRLVVGAQWALAILAAHAIDGWLTALRGAATKRWRGIVVAGVTIASTVAIGLEYGSDAIPLIPMDVPPVYADVIADDRIKVICDWPIRQKLQISNWYMYWQTVHGRRAVNGYFTHHSQAADSLVERIKTWDALGDDHRDELRSSGVDAVVFHQQGQPSQLIRLTDTTAAVSP